MGEQENNVVVQGERGPKGDHGQDGDIGPSGNVGERGAKGERGDTGPEGKSTVLARHVSVSFLLLTLIATAVLLVLGYAIKANRDVIHHNGALIRQVAVQQAEISALTLRTHTTLCTFVIDLQKRHDDSVAYLKAHPRGVISPVTQAVIFSRAEIQRSIDQQAATLKSLSGLRCKGGQ